MHVPHQAREWAIPHLREHGETSLIVTPAVPDSEKHHLCRRLCHKMNDDVHSDTGSSFLPQIGPPTARRALFGIYAARSA